MVVSGDGLHYDSMVVWYGRNAGVTVDVGDQWRNLMCSKRLYRDGMDEVDENCNARVGVVVKTVLEILRVCVCEYLCGNTLGMKGCV